MRILLDQAAHDMRNKGNNALLEVAALRLMKYWSDASFDIITLAPHLTRLYYPWSRPVMPDRLQPFVNGRERFFGWLPEKILWLMLELREEMFHRQMEKTRFAGGLQPSAESGGEIVHIGSGEGSLGAGGEESVLRHAISSYDLVVATGGGYFCDSDKPRLLKVFERLEAAVQQNIPAIMVGQGIGPLGDPSLKERARQVLPKVDLICAREQRFAMPILHELGVPAEKIMMTGDDAIELAYNARISEQGFGIGVSMRISSYTQVHVEHVEKIRAILHAAAREFNAPLIAVPISSAPHESDISHIQSLMDGYSNRIPGWRKLDRPRDAIERTGKCRIMLAGTYHGAIFALAQGIPVVGLARSKEYFDKLSSLVDEFGRGCRVLHMDDENFEKNLSSALREMWSTAGQLKPQLLEASERQIRMGYEAYDRIIKIVSERQNKPIQRN